MIAVNINQNHWLAYRQDLGRKWNIAEDFCLFLLSGFGLFLFVYPYYNNPFRVSLCYNIPIGFPLVAIALSGFLLVSLWNVQQKVSYKKLEEKCFSKTTWYLEINKTFKSYLFLYSICFHSYTHLSNFRYDLILVVNEYQNLWISNFYAENKTFVLLFIKTFFHMCYWVRG